MEIRVEAGRGGAVTARRRAAVERTHPAPAGARKEREEPSRVRQGSATALGSLELDELEGAYELVAEGLVDLQRRHEQLVAAALDRMACDDGVRDLVESSLHDMSTATRRVSGLLAGLFRAAAAEGRMLPVAAGPGAASGTDRGASAPAAAGVAG